MYPANSTVALPEVFTANATVPGRAGDDGPGDDRRQPPDVARHVDRHGAALSAAAPSANRLPRPLVAGLVAVPVAFLVVFYAWPFAELLARGLRPSAIADTLGRSSTWRVAWFTLWQALASTAATIVIGLAPAYVIARFAFVGRRLLNALLAAVFVLPTVVMGAAVLALLPDGWERGVGPILLAHVIFNLAVVVRTVGAVWDHLPPDLEAAAATLGASPWRAFREVTLPLLRPAILAAASIVFVFTFTSFGVIRVLGEAGTATIEVEVWRQATQIGDIGAAGDARRAAAGRRRRRRSRGRHASSGATAAPSPCARSPGAAGPAAAASALLVAAVAGLTGADRRRPARRTRRAVVPRQRRSPHAHGVAHARALRGPARDQHRHRPARLDRDVAAHDGRRHPRRRRHRRRRLPRHHRPAAGRAAARHRADAARSPRRR